MNERQIAKRYLLSVVLLYAGGAILLGAYIFALRSRSPEAFSVSQVLALAFLLPLVPTASYAGFVTAFLRVKELSRKQMVLLVVLFPLVLAGVTVYGLVMLIPSVVKYIIVLLKQK